MTQMNPPYTHVWRLQDNGFHSCEYCGTALRDGLGDEPCPDRTSPPSPVAEGQPVAWTRDEILYQADALQRWTRANDGFPKAYAMLRYLADLAAPVPPAAAAGGGEAVAVLRDVLKWCEDHDWGHIPEPGLLYERAERVFAAAPPPLAAPAWSCRVCGYPCDVLAHRPGADPKPAAQSEREALPEELFDGVAVLAEITERERRHTGAENVIAVLDAVVRLIRKRHAALSPEPPR